MPKIEWKDENRRYALGFFPLMGVIIGGILILWRIICGHLCIGQSLFSAAAAAFPVLISGGIHMDGFCDVTDAIHSYGDKNRRLEIMSDPHTGAFALIYTVIYFILQYGLFTQIFTVREAMAAALGYVFSRVFSAFSVILLKKAKENSSLGFFSKAAHKRITLIMELAYLAVFLPILLFISPVRGMAAAALLPVLFFLFRNYSYRSFGGITGDLCGWYLQVTELVYLTAMVFVPRIVEVVF